MASVRVGISGWVYPAWRGVFYPAGLPQARELAYAAAHFTSIELNGSFYSLQRPASYRRWAETTPEGFVFAVKGGRFITHMKRLLEAQVPLANFFASGVLALGPKLGPVLWQLPPTMTFDADRLTTFLDLLPRTMSEAAALAARHATLTGPDRAYTVSDTDRPLRHAVEVRHPSFASDDALRLCRDWQVAVVVADSAGRWPAVEDVGQDFRYVRLHGADELYVSGYTPDGLDRWARRIRGWADAGQDVYVYFDNDAKVHAPRDAAALMRRLGLRPITHHD